MMKEESGESTPGLPAGQAGLQVEIKFRCAKTLVWHLADSDIEDRTIVNKWSVVPRIVYASDNWSNLE